MMSDAQPPETVIETPPPVNRLSRLRRLGCLLLLVGWFLFLLTPCALFALAANGEIRLDQPDAPQPHAQPRLLIRLISDVDNRGIQILRSSRVGDASEDSICMRTAVNYLLWASSGGNQDVVYCDCYSRDNADAGWTLSATHPGACP